MALWTPSALVSGISGQVGGVVFHGGARSNVIARASTRVRTATPEQDRWQRALVALSRLWYEVPETVRAGWNSYAATHTFPNAMGRMRHRTGQALFTQFCEWTDPFLEEPYPFYNFPPTGTCPPYTDVSLDFTEGGPYYVTLTYDAAAGYYEYMTIQRFLQYGKRPGPGSMHRIAPLLRNANTENWYGRFLSQGIELLAGEQFRLELFWYRSTWWPSQSLFITGTVA